MLSRRTNWRLSIFIGLPLLIFATTAFAQYSPLQVPFVRCGTVVVKNERGKPLANINIQISRQTGKWKNGVTEAELQFEPVRKSSTGPDGSLDLSQLNPGTYTAALSEAKQDTKFISFSIAQLERCTEDLAVEVGPLVSVVPVDIGQTDDQGRFDLGTLTPGKYRFLASPSRAFAQPHNLDCHGQSECKLEITLKVNPADLDYAACPIK